MKFNYMKKILTTLLLLSTNVFAGMTVAEYQKNVSTNDIGWYLVGLGNGFDFSNTELEALKQKRLYCRPSNTKLTEQELRGMINSWISQHKIEEIRKIQIEPVLLSQLIKKYPCK